MRGNGGAEDILRRHVVERRRLATLHSATLDEEPHPSMPSMSRAQFIASCSLVRGIEEWFLDIVEEWACESDGATWIADAVHLPSGVVNIPIEQEAIRLTLTQAARRKGCTLTYRELQRVYRQAIATIVDNLLAQAGRSEPL